MSIISQVGVVILIVFILVILFRSNKNLKKASEEGESFVDEWALRQEKKEELKQRREEKKLEKQKRRKKIPVNDVLEESEDLEEDNIEEPLEEINKREDWQNENWDENKGYNGESLRVNDDWLYNYEEEEQRRQEQMLPEQESAMQKETLEYSGKIVPMKKKETTGITLMKLDANHRVMGRYRVNQIPFTIGRSSNNDLVLDDLCVARNHCRIVEKDGRYILEDVGTMNKLYVNGMVTSQVPLSDGLRIYIGNEEFQIEVEGGRSQSTRLYKNVEGNYE